MSQQSQGKFVDTVESWSSEQCRRNLNSALPAALLKLEESAYIADSIKMIQVICRQFLPCLAIEELEEKLFSHLSHVAADLIESSLNKINLNLKGALKDTAEELREVLIECIQWVMDINQCLESCLRHVSSYGHCELDQVRSLLTCTVKVLLKSYTHCKDSPDVYGDLLEQLSDPLTAVYKQAAALQVVFLGTLEKMERSGPALEDHVEVLAGVCQGLFEVVTAVTSLDVKLTASLWRGFTKLCSQQLSLLQDRFDVCPMICFLCREIQSGYDYLFYLCRPPDPESLSQGDEKTFSKSVKILTFQLKVVVALLRDFADYLGSCEKEVLELLVCLLRRLPPSLKAEQLSEKQEAEVRGQIVSAIGATIKHMLANRAFRTALVLNPNETAEEDYLPLLLLQLMVLDTLPKTEVELLDFWLTPTHHDSEHASTSLLTAVFQSFQLCWVEARVPVMLPGVMTTGKPQRSASLFEHVATHLSGFIGACPAVHFSHLEETLLQQAIHGGSFSHLLAVDCWCFLVRYGTASVCRDQVFALLSARTKLATRKDQATESILSRLGFLLQRLIKFMSPKDQLLLVTDYPPKQYSSLWIDLLTQGLRSEVVSEVTQELLSWSLSVLSQITVKASCVMSSLTVLIKLVGMPNRQVFNVSQQTEISSIISSMWQHLHSERSCPGYTAKLIQLTATLTEICPDPDVLIVVLDTVLLSLTSRSPLNLSLSVNLFLHVIVENQLVSFDAMDSFAAVLSGLVHHSHPLVCHSGLTTLALTQNNSTTAHVLKELISKDESLKGIFEKFTSSPDKEFDLVDYLKVMNASDLNKLKDHIPSLTSVGSGEMLSLDTSSQVSENSEPLAKRRKEDKDFLLSQSSSSTTELLTPTGPTDYQDIIERLKSAADDLEAQNRGNHPTWFKDTVEKHLARISLALSGKDWFDGI